VHLVGFAVKIYYDAQSHEGETVSLLVWIGISYWLLLRNEWSRNVLSNVMGVHLRVPREYLVPVEN
jgi:hypothetical protein